MIRRALGPYFAVDTHGPPPGEPWVPLAALLASPDLLLARIAATRAALGTGVEFRVAASVTHLGLVARLLSPALGAAASGGILRLDPATTFWQPVLGGPFPLSVAAGPGPDVDVLDGPIAAITEMTAALSVSRSVLWGNVASAVNGAVRMIAYARPDLAAAAVPVGDRTLRDPRLAGAYTSDPFRRRSCCLIYRVGPAGGPPAYCGDCILAP